MNLQQNISLAEYSSFRIGGAAKYFVDIETEDDLREAVAYAADNNLPIWSLGGGSNIVFSDDGFCGVILHFMNKNIVHKKNGVFVAESGVLNGQLYEAARKTGHDYGAWLTIPGTIGGAVAGNAGAYGSETADILVEAEIFDTEMGNFFTAEADFFEYSYRHSRYHGNPADRSRYIIWSATFDLPAGEPAAIAAHAAECLQFRKDKQPWGKTGGSFFANPSGDSAGRLLDAAGLKELQVGGAFLSKKHANFLMNDGSATQADIIELGQKAIAVVQEQFGVTLQNEVRLIDDVGSSIFL